MTPVILTAAVAGACLYRWRGAAHRLKKYTPRPMTQILFALPYACVIPLQPTVPVALLIAAVVLILTTLGVLTGHGGFMDLGRYKPDREPERLEFVIRWLHGRIPEYWYDALGLAVTGLAVTLPAGIATMNPLLAISGILKAPAYMIGRNTEQGEWLTGAFLWGSLAALA